MKSMERQGRSKFVLCVTSDDLEDVEQRKIYQVLPDAAAAREGYVRIIDESGEDYLYPSDYFVPVKLPAVATRELLSTNYHLQRSRTPAKKRLRSAH